MCEKINFLYWIFLLTLYSNVVLQFSFKLLSILNEKHQNFRFSSNSILPKKVQECNIDDPAEKSRIQYCTFVSLKRNELVLWTKTGVLRRSITNFWRLSVILPICVCVLPLTLPKISYYIFLCLCYSSTWSSLIALVLDHSLNCTINILQLVQPSFYPALLAFHNGPDICLGA